MKDLEQFIEENIDITNEYSTLIKEINKLSRFINERSLEMTPDMYLNILNNNKINNIIKNIVEIKFVEIREGKLKTLSNNEILITLIKYYCDLKNIKYERVYIETENSKKSWKETLKANASFTEEEQVLLLKKLNLKDENARKLLIENNIKLVLHRVNKFTHNKEQKDDAFQEGMIGLILAIDLFDIEKNVKFSTYTTWWIDSYIKRYLKRNEQIIKIPYHIKDKYSKYNEAEQNLEKRLCRKPTLEEITKETGYSKKEINEIILSKSSNYISFNNTTSKGNDEDMKIEDAIADEKTSNIPDDVINKIFKEELRKIISDLNLTENERYVFKMRTGINEQNEIKTLNELAIELNLTKERIRAIETRTFKKIFSSKAILKLASYTEDEEFSKKVIKNVRDANKNTKHCKGISRIQIRKIIESLLEEQKQERSKALTRSK